MTLSLSVLLGGLCHDLHLENDSVVQLEMCVTRDSTSILGAT